MLLFTFTISGGNTLSKTHPHLVIIQTSAICTSGRFIAKLPLVEKMPNGNGHNLSFFISTQRFEPTISSAKFK